MFFKGLQANEDKKDEKEKGEKGCRITGHSM
jgi:hypothetical protein